MKNNYPGPNWLVLDLLFGIFILVFLFEVKLPFSVTGHKLAEIGLVLLFFGLIVWWLKANEAALIREDWEKSKIHERWLPIQSHGTSEHAKGLEISSIKKQERDRSASWVAGWSIPTWIIAIWSYLSDYLYR